MANNIGYVTTIKNVRKHPNADKLQLGDCFGNTVCVSLDYTENQIGIYFPVDLQLSVEFATKNNLLRKKDENGVNIGGYMDENKRNITAIKLRGEKSDGLFLPISCLDYCFDKGTAETNLKIGDTISVVNGHEICDKYIPKTTTRSASNKSKNGNMKHKKVDIAPLFKEHIDTTQLAYNLNAFKPGDIIEISLKMHGTSQRTGYLKTLKKYKRTIFDKLFKKEGTPIYDRGYVTGTRRTVLSTFEGGYYGNDSFREIHAKNFEEKLLFGETVYYEVVGYVNESTPIMGKAKVPKENKMLYGNEMTFDYGCAAGESDMYVYRMTMTNEDGDVIEYSPSYMRYRCEQMGIKCVPTFGTFIIPEDVTNAGEYVKELAEKFYDGIDPIGKTHVREGVVVRILNRPNFAAYKHKNFLFKLTTGIIKDNYKGNLSEDILSEL